MIYLLKHRTKVEQSKRNKLLSSSCLLFSVTLCICKLGNIFFNHLAHISPFCHVTSTCSSKCLVLIYTVKLFNAPSLLTGIDAMLTKRVRFTCIPNPLGVFFHYACVLFAQFKAVFIVTLEQTMFNLVQ